jgi:21S rRNA (uridine2791-2'-O)-methyltransferase
MERTRPHGRVIGIDLIPAQPPRGVATFQGDFLSPSVRAMVKNLIVESHQKQPPPPARDSDHASDELDETDLDRPSYIDMERHATPSAETSETKPGASSERLVDVCPPCSCRLKFQLC